MYPPFRADHVGSLPRRAELLRARGARIRQANSAAALQRPKMRRIGDTTWMQPEFGLDGVAHREFRRDLWLHSRSTTSTTTSRYDGHTPVVTVVHRPPPRFIGKCPWYTTPERSQIFSSIMPN